MSSQVDRYISQTYTNLPVINPKITINDIGDFAITNILKYYCISLNLDSVCRYINAYIKYIIYRDILNRADILIFIKMCNYLRWFDQRCNYNQRCNFPNFTMNNLALVSKRFYNLYNMSKNKLFIDLQEQIEIQIYVTARNKQQLNYEIECSPKI